MIERMAKALYVAFWETTPKLTPPSWEKAQECYRDQSRSIARAAIAAMREPTQAMVDACDFDTPSEGIIRSVWADMIDAALEGK